MNFLLAYQKIRGIDLDGKTVKLQIVRCTSACFPYTRMSTQSVGAYPRA